MHISGDKTDIKNKIRVEKCQMGNLGSVLKAEVQSLSHSY